LADELKVDFSGGWANSAKLMRAAVRVTVRYCSKGRLNGYLFVDFKKIIGAWRIHKGAIWTGESLSD
jgi:hypothetical protein